VCTPLRHLDRNRRPPFERDCSVRFKPENCDVCPLRVHDWRAHARNKQYQYLACADPLIATQKGGSDHPFLQPKAALPPSSPSIGGEGVPLQRDCAVRFKPQNYDVCPLWVRGWRSATINCPRSMTWMCRPAD
jgi:hypothetical protein